MFLSRIFKKRPRSEKGHRPDRGIMVFESTSEVIRAEQRLKEQGLRVQVMGPPPEIRTGCDLVIVFPLIEELNILRLLSSDGVSPLQATPLDSPLLEPVSLFSVKDFGEHIMVRAANMKITVNKNTRVIVNISGGGCPDVPYLAREMVGRRLEVAPKPREIGHTLCGYALQLAFEEVNRRCS